MTRFLYASKHKLVKTLFKEAKFLSSHTAGRRPVSLSRQFMASVGDLMKNLLAKNPHYIRCIKPNEHKKANNVDDQLIRHQVGLLLERSRIQLGGGCQVVRGLRARRKRHSSHCTHGSSHACIHHL